MKGQMKGGARPETAANKGGVHPAVQAAAAVAEKVAEKVAVPPSVPSKPSAVIDAAAAVGPQNWFDTITSDPLSRVFDLAVIFIVFGFCVHTYIEYSMDKEKGELPEEAERDVEKEDKGTTKSGWMKVFGLVLFAVIGWEYRGCFSCAIQEYSTVCKLWFQTFFSMVGPVFENFVWRSQTLHSQLLPDLSCKRNIKPHIHSHCEATSHDKFRKS
ncbi:unnamed protein product [Amoebophrya sp. A120]|nr:unnamed protein product [Amoebophrya sp. A120]|eukprot:GSA120T00016975001.1